MPVIAFTGRVDDDDQDDLVVILDDVDGSLIQDVAAVFLGPLDGDLRASDAVVRVVVSDTLFSRARAAAGADLNGDGFLDLVIADPQRAAQRGRVSVLYGPLVGESDLADAPVVIDGGLGACVNDADAGDHVGLSVQVADGDGGGVDDLYVGMGLATDAAGDCVDRTSRSVVGVLRGGRR